MREPVLAFVRLSRPRFLVESLLTATLGLAVAVRLGHGFQPGTWALVQLTIVLTHLMTHYCNEYFDLAADSAHTAPNRWTGGSQVLVRGALRPEVSLAAAFVLLFVVVLLTALMPQTPQRVIAVVAIALAWFYTAPPVRLNYRALGEVTTAASLTVLCPLLMSFSLSGTVSPLLPAVCVPLFLCMTARMTVMNFCDRDSDLLAGKHTLPNRLGPRRAGLLVAGLHVAAYLIVLAVTAAGVLPVPAGVALALTAPVGYLLCRRVLHDPPSADAPDRATTTALLGTVHAASTGIFAVLGLIVTAGIEHGMTRSVWACVVIFGLYLALSGAVQVKDALGRRNAEEVLR